MSTELKDLVGLHMLDAVDFETISVPEWPGADTFEDANTCRFRIDGVVWAVIEDPNDGYRSSMRELVRLGDVEMKNVFTPVQVLALYRDRERYGYDKVDILMMHEVLGGKCVLEVGTEASDDYYPSFVADFQPQNMPVNAEAAS